MPKKPNKASPSKGAKKASARRPARGSGGANPEELLTYYRGMLEIRRFEEKAGQMYGLV